MEPDRFRLSLKKDSAGVADAVLMKYEAEAKGIKQVLESKAEGYRLLVESTGVDAKAAATLLLLEKLEEIVRVQVEAIKNIKIDKITVWDNASAGHSSTANFMSGLIKSIPPIHDIAKMAGVDLPEFLGKIAEEAESKQSSQNDKDV